MKRDDPRPADAPLDPAMTRGTTEPPCAPPAGDTTTQGKRDALWFWADDGAPTLPRVQG